MVLARSDSIGVDDVHLDQACAATLQGEAAFLPDGMTLDQYEQQLIREALSRADNNKSQAARLLGLTRNALRYRLSQMGVEE